MTSVLPLKPLELHSVSCLTARADSPSVRSSVFKVTLLISAALKPFKFHQSFLTMYRNSSLNLSTDSNVFYVEQSSVEGSPIQNNTPAILNSTEISEPMERGVITISSLASPEPRIVTLDSDSNDPTIPYGFGSQQSIVPPSLNDLNLPPNPFNVLATMAVVRVDDAYSPQSPEPSIPSPISTPPMDVSTIEGWDTTHTTIDDNTFYTDDEPRRVYWDISSSDTFDSNEPRNAFVASSPSSTPPPAPQQKRKLSIGMSFPQRGQCRSTPARHAANPFHKERDPNAQGKTQTLTRLLTDYF